MSRNSLIISAALLVGLLGAGEARGRGHDSSGTSEGGRVAYARFLKATVFMTGYYVGADRNPAYRQLRGMLREDGSVEVFRNLARYGAPGGRLYGFLGLHLTDAKVFAEEAERYRAARRPEPSLFGFYAAQPPREKVERVQGCIGWVGDVETEIGRIEDGAYDEDFRKAAE